MSKKLLLFSGGPDSTAAAYLLKGSHSDLHLLTLSDETKAKNIGELKAANKIAAMLSLPYKVVDVSALNAFLDGLPNILMSLGTGGEKKADFVFGEDGAPLSSKPLHALCSLFPGFEKVGFDKPASSQFLHTLCALHGIANGYESMIWGVHIGDNRIAGNRWLAEYVQHFNGMLEQSGFSFKLETPFLKWSKSKLMLEAMKLGAPMHLTFSCIIPGAEEPCGECAGCQERNKAIAEIEEIELMPEIAAMPTASIKESKVLAL